MQNKNQKIRIHFIGIGGIGMSGIAELMKKIGYTVSGSDIIESENVKRLKEIGIVVSIGHHKKNISEVNAVVYSSAVKQNNSEIKEAKKAHTWREVYKTADEAPEGAIERTRLGIRYPELLAFIGAATEQRLTSIEARLTALEG